MCILNSQRCAQYTAIAPRPQSGREGQLTRHTNRPRADHRPPHRPGAAGKAERRHRKRPQTDTSPVSTAGSPKDRQISHRA